ncbi:MAG: tripartite tricarboxylate transporter substrate-binding protein [Burkholderiales bacterium]|nr:tripartite tricarboxylate transporter substrate-binding protein [Burkholderiales bacterium]
MHRFPLNNCLKLAVIAALGLTAITAAAQSYPAKTVRIIAPFPAGGSSDLVARILAQKLTEANGQQFIVDNRPGAGGTLGTEIASKSAPDGYTLSVGNVAPLAVNVSLFKKLPCDPVTDFAPIALAKARPGQLNYGSGGSGTPAHLTGELFRYMAKVNIVHVSYKNTGQSVNDLIAGHIQFIFASMPVALPHVKNGRRQHHEAERPVAADRQAAGCERTFRRTGSGTRWHLAAAVRRVHQVGNRQGRAAREGDQAEA